jgi:ribulose-5-phosphate 4-epimerase/fuculose-1-phosphate aldolase
MSEQALGCARLGVQAAGRLSLGRSMKVINPEHLAEIRSDGESPSEGGPEPTVELLTHLRIYQHRPDVGTLDSHKRWSRLFAAYRMRSHSSFSHTEVIVDEKEHHHGQKDRNPAPDA